MNKLTIALVAALLAVVAGLPPVVGSVTESRIRAQAEQISGNEFFAVEVIAYERGWTNSTATVEVGLSETYAAQIAQAIERRGMRDRDPLNNENVTPSTPTTANIREALGDTVVLLMQVAHGPVLLGDGVQLGLGSSVIRLHPDTEGLAELLEELGIPYLFEIRTRTGLTSVSQFEAEVPPIERETLEERVSFSGFFADGSYDFQNGRILSNARMERLQAESPASSVTVENLRFAGDNVAFSRYLWLGSAELDVERLRVEAGLASGVPGAPPALEAANLGMRFDAALDESGERVAMDMRYFVDSVSGEDVNLTDMSFDVNLRDLDTAALEAYYELTRQLAWMTEDSPPMTRQMEETVYRMLASSPSVELGPVRFWWNEDPFEARVRIDVDSEQLPAQVAFSMMDYRLWPRLLSVDAFIEVSEEMAHYLAAEAMKLQLRRGAGMSGEELDPDSLDSMAAMQAPGMLLILVAQGVIEESATGYRAAILYDSGQLTINGTPIPLGPF